jgi:uncharacterized protein YraI
MDDVRNDVAALMSGSTTTSSTTTTTTSTATSSAASATTVNYTGTVTASSLNCRSGAGTNYSIVTSYAKGTKVSITKELNGWGYTGKGWVSLDYITKTTTTTSSSSSTSYKVKVTASNLNIRKGPGTSYATNGAITDKGTYTIVATSDNWGKLKSGKGWICLDYTEKV